MNPEDLIGRTVIANYGERMVLSEIKQAIRNSVDEGYEEVYYKAGDLVAVLVPNPDYPGTEKTVSRDRLAQWLALGVWRVE